MPQLLSAIQLSQLRQALIVVEEGSFIRAGKRLNIHYSQVSRRIRDLEQTIGIRIFVRGSRGVVPTPQGAEFLEGVRRVMFDLSDVMRLTGSSIRSPDGTLAVGFYVSLLDGELCEITREFVRRHPKVGLELVEAPRADLAVALNNQAVDVVISTTRNGVGDASLPLWRDRILAAFRRDHPLSAKPVIEWEDLVSQTIILRRHEPGNELRALLRAKAGDGKPLCIKHHDVGRDSLLGLVRKGDGVALVYETDARISHRDIVYRDIHDPAGCAETRFLASWRSENENPILCEFLRLLHERYPAEPEGPIEPNT